MPPGSGSDTEDYLDRFLSSAFDPLDDGMEDRERCATLAASDEGLDIPATIDRYPVAGLLARGGVGLVYRVSDPELGRELAVKVLRPSLADREEIALRFVAEAKLCSRLAHPGIVPVHELGTLADGRPYFTMRVVEGQTLARLLADRDHPAKERLRFLEIFEKVCLTLAYAHAHGIIHGDLKPQNIMVGIFGEVQVMDWGFAHQIPEAPAIESDDSSSSSSPVGGTVAYMAPEQAAANRAAITTRTDVFGLGAVLCEILTGAPPYLGESKREILERAARAALEDVQTRLAACVSDEILRRIALDCLAAEQGTRPRDAGAVADRLSDYLGSLEARTRELELEAAAAHARIEQERRTRRLAVVLTAVIALFALLGSAAWLWRRSENLQRMGETRRAVESSLAKAELLRDQAQGSADGGLELLRQALAALQETRAWVDSREAEPGLRQHVSERVGQLEFESAKVRRELQARHDLELIRPHLGDDRAPHRADLDYRAAFRACGIDLEAQTPEEVEAVIRASSISDSLIQSLDHWTHLRRRHGIPGPEAWRELHELAQRLDADPWRRDLREAYRAGATERLIELAQQTGARTEPPGTIDLLARCLWAFGEGELAIEVYRRGVLAHPTDYALVHNLAGLLGAREAIPSVEMQRLLWMAVTIRPDSAHILTDLARALLLHEQVDEPAALLERALALDPGYGRAHMLMGVLHERRGNPESAQRSFEESLRLGEWTASIAYSGALLRAGYLVKAVEVLRAGVALEPNSAQLHLLLGTYLGQLQHDEEALEHLRAALAIEPQMPEALCNLGIALADRGEFEAALRSLRRGHERGSQRRDWSYDSARWVNDVEHLLALVEPLDDFIDGGPPPGEGRACAALADCAQRKGRYRVAAELFEHAFELESIETWSVGVVFQAAEAALWAALDAQLDAETRADRCEQALTWLSIAIERNAEAHERGQGDDARLRTFLERCQHSSRWIPAHDAAFRESLSAEECVAWDQLWRDLEELRASID